MTKPLPADVLEAKAATQRRQLHDSVTDLRTTLRETFDVKRQARNYLAPAAGATAFVGLLLGYTVAGIFTRR